VTGVQTCALPISDADDADERTILDRRSRVSAASVRAPDEPETTDAGPLDVDGAGVMGPKVGSALSEGPTPAG